MLSKYHMQPAKRWFASLATAGLLIAGLAGPAAAATSPSLVGSTDPAIPVSRPNDPCTDLSNLPNRPTVTQSTCVVPKGHALIEAGYTSSTTKSPSTHTSVYPQAQIRIGTNIKNLEIAVNAPNEVRYQPNSGSSIHGLTDSAIGAKYFIGASKRFAHSVAVGTSLPTGDAVYTSNAYSLSASYNASYALTKQIGLAATETLMSNGSAASSTAANPNPPTFRYGSSTTSLVASGMVPKIAKVFVEDAVSSHNLGNGTSMNKFTGGVSRVLGQRVQADLEYTSSSNKVTGGPTTTAHGIGGGLAFFL